jgi:spore coat polysaccharide biosynthesis protein SpsF
MSSELIVVQARMSSTRLPGKALLKLNDTTIVEFLLTKLEDTKRQVILATSTHDSDDILAALCKDRGVDCYRGSLENVFSRFLSISDRYNVKKIVRITADNPFVDVDEINYQLLHSEEENYYFDGIGEDGYVPGLGFEIFSSDLLKRFEKDIVGREDYMEHVTLCFRENMRFFSRPEGRLFTKINYPEISVTIDTFEDFVLAKYIMNNLKLRDKSAYQVIQIAEQFVNENMLK